MVGLRTFGDKHTVLMQLKHSIYAFGAIIMPVLGKLILVDIPARENVTNIDMIKNTSNTLQGKYDAFIGWVEKKRFFGKVGLPT